MKTIVTVMILVLTTYLVSAQNDLKVYKTYNDYINDTGEEYSFDGFYWPRAIGLGLVAKKGKVTVKINGKEYWGYKYKDALFRFDDQQYNPARVISIGKIIYYENGQAHMEMLRKNKTSGEFSYGYVSYVSKSLETDLVPINSFLLRDTESNISVFKKEYPEYNDFFDCIGKKYETNITRECLDKFEGR